MQQKENKNQEKFSDEAIKLVTKKYKIIIWFFVVLIIALIIAFSFALGRVQNKAPEFETNPNVNQITKIGELVGLKVFIGDVLNLSDDRGFLKEVQGLWIIKGDALISTDMQKAQIFMDKGNKVISLILDEPHVISPRVDHEKTKQYDLKTGIFVSSKEQAELYQAAMKQAQQAIEYAASLDDFKKIAKENIESMIRIVIKFSYPEWEIQIKWQKME